MKTLEKNVRRHESKAKRTLARRQAAKLAKQAAKFRLDALQAGCDVHDQGGRVYTDSHPVYNELIEPLLKEVTLICQAQGFDFLLQVRTPMTDHPNLTMALCGIKDQPTPTMNEQLELIKARPQIVKKDGKLVVEEKAETPAEPQIIHKE
jgi:hypothetical protein